MAMSVRILRLNVAGLNNIVKLQRISKLLRSERADILYLQEMHIRKEKKYFKKVFLGIIHPASVRNRSRGILVALSHKMHWQELRKVVDKEGKYVLVQGLLLGTGIAIVGVYVCTKQWSGGILE